MHRDRNPWASNKESRHIWLLPAPPPVGIAWVPGRPGARRSMLAEVVAVVGVQANVKKWIDDIMPLVTVDEPLVVDGGSHVLPLDQAPHA